MGGSSLIKTREVHHGRNNKWLLLLIPLGTCLLYAVDPKYGNGKRNRAEV